MEIPTTHLCTVPAGQAGSSQKQLLRAPSWRVVRTYTPQQGEVKRAASPAHRDPSLSPVSGPGSAPHPSLCGLLSRQSRVFLLPEVI